VVSYRPILADKPLSCNLNHCEMFSCILGMEDETALSIIDPVTVNMEVTCRPHNLTTRGIADAIISSSDRVLEVSSSVNLYPTNTPDPFKSASDEHTKWVRCGHLNSPHSHVQA